MPNSKQRFQQKAAELAALTEKTLTQDDFDDLQNALLGNNNYLAAQAAAVVAQKKIDGLMPDLLAAYDFFMDEGAKRDKGCLAKTAVVKALVALNAYMEALYLQGVRCRQMEPVYGGQADTAADLRSQCALGLLQMGYEDILLELVNLLQDGELQCRMTAVSALVSMGSDASELLLRFKCLAGDPDPKVIDNCFAGLLEINLDRSLSFVAQFVEGEDEVLAESAALALGEASDLRAFKLLHGVWESTVSESRRTALMLPIALTRQEAAFQFLFETIKMGPEVYAKAALEACRIYDYDEAFQERVRAAQKGRKLGGDSENSNADDADGADDADA
jgi:HEAT repeat protein